MNEATGASPGMRIRALALVRTHSLGKAVSLLLLAALLDLAPVASQALGVLAHAQTITKEAGLLAYENSSSSYVVEADGTAGRYFLPANEGLEWSPDGSKIAYGYGGIYTANADGSARQRLGTGSQPTWSPDGTQIAYSAWIDGAADIFVMNAADGTGVVNLTNSPGHDAAPDWASTGRITFTSNRTGQYDVYLMNADGTGQSSITNDITNQGYPVWSPDATKIAFTGDWQVSVVDADGSNRRDFTQPSLARGVAWSPDGTQLAYSSGEVYVMNSDGSDVRLVAASNSAEVQDWQSFNCTVVGTSGDDLLVGTEGDDVLCGLDGNDSISLGAGNDVVVGGQGTDTLDASQAGAPINLNLRSGVVTGGATGSLIGIEAAVGSNFDDMFHGKENSTLLDGGPGSDTVSFAGSTPSNLGPWWVGITIDLAVGSATGDGHDELIAIENAIGSRRNDTLISGGGSNVLDGGEGSDTVSFEGSSEGVTFDLSRNTTTGQGSDRLRLIEDFKGSPGDDIFMLPEGQTNHLSKLDGAEGHDTVNAAALSTDVEVDLESAWVRGTTHQKIHSIEGVTGSRFGDLIIGDASSNTIDGGGGDDEVRAGGGNDELVGGEGEDDFFGGGGNDVITSFGGPDEVSGGAGEDILSTGDGADWVSGDDGNDSLDAGADNDVLYGFDGNDELTGSSGDDKLNGGRGDDDLVGGEGTDGVVFFERSPLTVNLPLGWVRGAGADSLSSVENAQGGSGGDLLIGDPGANALRGGRGDDVIVGNGGDDVLSGDSHGKFGDVVSYRFAPRGIDLDAGAGTARGSGADKIAGFETVIGSAYRDLLRGSSRAETFFGYGGNDRLDGAGGNDLLIPMQGDDSVEGGAGFDMVDFEYSPRAVTVDLARGIARGDGTDRLAGVAAVFGSRYADEIVGTAASNLLIGWLGNDVLKGLGGFDALFGDKGSDRHDAGGSNDYIDARDGTTNNDHLIGGPGYNTCRADRGDRKVGCP